MKHKQMKKRTKTETERSEKERKQTKPRQANIGKNIQYRPII